MDQAQARPSSGSTGKKVPFREHADDLVYVALNSAKYDDYDENLEKEHLIEFIMNEVRNRESDLQTDIGDCELDIQNIDLNIQKFQQKADDMVARANVVKNNKLQACRTAIQQFKDQLASKKQDYTDKRAQINELNNLIKSMQEQKNKDVKNADEKNIKNIKNIFADGKGDDTMTYILDSLMQLITLEKGASYAKNGADIFTVGNYGESIRKCKPQNLDKDVLKDIAQKINQDAQGNQGVYAKNITQVNEPSKYLDFFCHFKVLFKLVQIGLSVKRLENLSKKMDKCSLEIQELESKITNEELVAVELEFHENMRKEAMRIQDQEIQFLQDKRMSVQQRLERLRGDDAARMFM